jgi:23S rRNA pseudouridine955/2504/2580 synthase
MRSSSTSRRALPPRAGPRPVIISTGCSTGWPTGGQPSQAGPPARQGHVGSASGRPHRPRRGLFSRSFSGRTAKKLYWALVVGMPSPEEGLIDAPLAKQPGTGGEKMHIDEEQGQSAKTRWRHDRPRRKPRRLGRASAAHRPDAPASSAHGGDGPPDRRRRQIWRRRVLLDRRGQPKASSPRSSAEDRQARRRKHRRHRGAPGPFRSEPRDAGLRGGCRRAARGQPSVAQDRKPRRQTRRGERRARGSQGRG